MLTHLNPDAARREEELQDCMLKSRRSLISDWMNSSQSIAAAARLLAFPVQNRLGGLKNCFRKGRRGDLPDSQGSLPIRTRLPEESCDELAGQRPGAGQPSFDPEPNEWGLPTFIATGGMSLKTEPAGANHGSIANECSRGRKTSVATHFGPVQDSIRADTRCNQPLSTVDFGLPCCSL